MTLYLRGADGETHLMQGAYDPGSPDAPLPLCRREAIHQAFVLSREGLSFPAVSRVMARYHGWYLSAGGWGYVVTKWHGGRPCSVALREARSRAGRISAERRHKVVA